MASGFQTSDGVDLDSRYLGINAKAKSAATADTATTATRANTLVNNRFSSKQVVVVVDLTANPGQTRTWTAPSDGIFCIPESASPPGGGNSFVFTVLGVDYGSNADVSTWAGWLRGVVLLVKKGDVFTNKSNTYTYGCICRFWPLV